MERLTKKQMIDVLSAIKEYIDINPYKEKDECDENCVSLVEYCRSTIKIDDIDILCHISMIEDAIDLLY